MISIKISEKSFSVLRLNELSTESELVAVKKLISSFSCPLNDEVERFLKNNALDFEAKNQSVTYLVFYENSFVAYFTLANKLIQVQKDRISKTVLKRLLRVAVYFLECDSDRQKVIDFYESNGFTLFSERGANSDKITLLQFMKKI